MFRRQATIPIPQFAGDGGVDDELELDATEDDDDANVTTVACVKPTKKNLSG